jgi:hypothetical protein
MLGEKLVTVKNPPITRAKREACELLHLKILKSHDTVKNLKTSELQQTHSQ